MKGLRRLLAVLVSTVVHISINVKAVILITMMGINLFYVTIVVLGIFSIMGFVPNVVALYLIA